MKILEKIKSFFRKIFLDKKVKKIEEKTKNTEKTVNNKEEFFKLYNNVKKGTCNLKKLTEEEQEDIIKMLDQEIKLKKNKLNQNITELNMLKYKNRSYEKNRILKLYDDVKNSKISPSKLDNDDLKKIAKLYVAQARIQDEQLEKEIVDLEKKIYVS